RCLRDVALRHEDDGGELPADSERVRRFDVDARLGELLQHAVVVADFIRVLYPERGFCLGRLAELGERLLCAVDVGGEEACLRLPTARLVRPTRGAVDLRFPAS